MGGSLSCSQKTTMFFGKDHNLRRSFTALLGAHTARSLIQTGSLLAGAGALAAVPGGLMFGTLGALLALLAVAGLAILATRLSPETVMRLCQARPLERGSHSQISGLVADLAQRAELARVPRLYVIPSNMLSAFSVGNSHRSCIAVTEGLLRRLTMREIAGVLAHEVSHIRDGDLAIMSIADMLTRFVQLLYYLGLGLAAYNLFHLLTGDLLFSWWAVALLVLAPALFNLLQFSLSRAREFDADRKAALLTGDPLGLASAISRFNSSTGRLYEDLLPPVPARRVPQPSMLRCHPPADVRIARLRAFEAPPMPPLDIAEEPRISLVGVGPIEMRPRYRWPGVWF